MDDKKLSNENNVSENKDKDNETIQSANNSKNKEKNKFLRTNYITKIALFSALAFVLSLIQFPVPFLPNFLKFNFSDFIFLIATFCLGTVAGSIVVVVKVLLSLFNSFTGYVGEFADLLCSLAFVLPAGLIYRKYRSFKGGIFACLIATISSTIVGVVCNWTFLVEIYARIVTWEGLLAAMRPLFKDITQEKFYAIYLTTGVLPFNLLRCLFASAITILSYKKLSILLKKF